MSYAAIVNSYNADTDRQEELRLLSLALAGSTRARTRFFLRYTEVVEARVRQVLRRAGNWFSEDDIQDMVSEVWLSLFDKDMRPLRRFDPSRRIKVSTWVGLLARNKTIDKLRSTRPGRTVSIEERQGAHEPRSSRPLPADLVEERQRRSMAALAMQQLSQQERHFMNAWYVDNREPEQLARDFNIALGTVYSRRFKIQAKLTRAVQRMTRPRHGQPGWALPS